MAGRFDADPGAGTGRGGSLERVQDEEVVAGLPVGGRSVMAPVRLAITARGASHQQREREQSHRHHRNDNTP